MVVEPDDAAVVYWPRRRGADAHVRRLFDPYGFVVMSGRAVSTAEGN